MNSRIKTVHLKLSSYTYEPLIAAINELRKHINTCPGVKFSAVALPNKQKYYCVNRSPHVNTNSREQFGVEELRQLIELKFSLERDPEDPKNEYNGMESLTFDTFMAYGPDPTACKLFDIVRSYAMPPGVYCEMTSKWYGLDYYINQRYKK